MSLESPAAEALPKKPEQIDVREELDNQYFESTGLVYKFDNPEDEQKFKNIVLDLAKDGIRFSDQNVLFSPELAFNKDRLDGFREILLNNVVDYADLLLQVEEENLGNERYVKALIKLKNGGVDFKDVFMHAADVSESINNVEYLENLVELQETGVVIDTDYILKHPAEESESTNLK